MKTLRYLLVADGASDKVLTPILEWTISQFLPDLIFESNFHCARDYPKSPKLNLRLESCLSQYSNLDLLFIHRDAEKESYQERISEIETALQQLKTDLPSHVCVVPVRMTEAWLLFDEPAIRLAAGNPTGLEPLGLPALRQVENLPDPKKILHDALKTASGLNRRRRQEFNVHRAIHRIHDAISDYWTLRNLPAFSMFENSLRSICEKFIAAE